MWPLGAAGQRGLANSGELAAVLGRGRARGWSRGTRGLIWALGWWGEAAGDGPRRRAAALPAAAGRPARERGEQGKAPDGELLWDLGEALGRPSGRQVEWKRSSSRRRAWRLGGHGGAAGLWRWPARAHVTRLKALNSRAPACQAQRLSLEARAGAAA
jgi:hypothetical protein